MAISAISYRLALTCVLTAVLLALGRGRVCAAVTVHTYSYNVDGALTAITTQVNQNTPATTYLTWDDFTPDPATPTTGTVSAGDGRLVGYGPSPGTDNLTARFAFDPRDRLLSYSGAAGTETYDYYANTMMRSSSTDADTRRFYYDASGNPQAVNLHDAAADRWSAWLDHTRFLDDGKEQILLAPRKDMACSYDAESTTLQSYVYDAFGASPNPGVSTDTYDLGDNPFRYAGEYRDPLWGGYYLRARWYDPDLPVFLSRDPARHLNRYAYGGGNPVMNTDPSGYGPGGLRGFLAGLNRGIGGHFARIFLAPLLGPLQIAAYPKQFWQSVKTDKGGIDVFLALGIVSEVGGGYADAVLAGFTRLGVRYFSRLASDTILGVGGSVVAGATSGSGHFDWNAFGQGLEYSANPFLMRGFAGFNVRSGFQFSATDAGDLFEQLRHAPDDTALVFRQRLSTGGGTTSLASLESSTGGLLGGNAGFDKPFTQAFHLSVYHEQLVAITKDGIFTNEVTDRGAAVGWQSFKGQSFDEAKASLSTRIKGKVEFVGRVDSFNARQQFLLNPFNHRVFRNTVGNFPLITRGGVRTTYSLLRNNCQYHAYAVLQDMGFR
jgi:RHS repeat-associated protein